MALVQKKNAIPQWMEFKHIPHSQIMAVRQLYETEPLIYTVCHIALAGVLGGGVVFHRKNMQLHDQAHDFYARVWSNFIREALFSMWQYGFVGVILEPHSTYRAVPRVLDMQQVDCRIKRDMTGRTQYIFLEQSASAVAQILGAKGLMSLETPIPHVMVFEMDPPDAQGNLRSRAALAWRERQLITHILRAETMAASHMSNPPLVMQRAVPVDALSAHVDISQVAHALFVYLFIQAMSSLCMSLLTHRLYSLFLSHHISFYTHIFSLTISSYTICSPALFVSLLTGDGSQNRGERKHTRGGTQCGVEKLFIRSLAYP